MDTKFLHFGSICISLVTIFGAIYKYNASSVVSPEPILLYSHALPEQGYTLLLKYLPQERFFSDNLRLYAEHNLRQMPLYDFQKYKKYAFIHFSDSCTATIGLQNPLDTLKIDTFFLVLPKTFEAIKRDTYKSI
jgi:hypothetical protein